MRWPSWIPGGISTSSVRSSVVRPLPRQSARGRKNLTAPSAIRTALCPYELAEHGGRNGLEPPSAPAAGTGFGARTESRAASMAGLAGYVDGYGDGAHDSARGLLEVDGHFRQDIGATAASPGSASPHAEELVAEEDGKEIGDVREVELGRPETAGSQPFVTEAVVELARLPPRKDLVCLRRLAKPFLRAGFLRHVRMELPSELAEGGLDLLLGSAAGDAEDVVVIASDRRHALSLVTASHGIGTPRERISPRRAPPRTATARARPNGQRRRP